MAAHIQFEIVVKDGLPGYTVPGMYISYHYTRRDDGNERIVGIDYPMCVIFPIDDTRVKVVYAHPINTSLRTRVEYKRFPYVEVGEMMYLEHNDMIQAVFQRIGDDKSLTDEVRRGYWVMGLHGKILSMSNKFKLTDLILLNEMPSDGHVLTIIREYSRICRANNAPMSEPDMKAYVTSVAQGNPRSLELLSVIARLQNGPLSPEERALLGPTRADKYDSLYTYFTRRDE